MSQCKMHIASILHIILMMINERDGTTKIFFCCTEYATKYNRMFAAKKYFAMWMGIAGQLKKMPNLVFSNFFKD